MPADAPSLIASLDTLLRAEAQTIRQGDFAAFATLAERKSSLVDHLVGLSRRDAAPALARLKARAEANQALLSAALEGVKAARARVDAIRRVGTSLDTYDSAGRAQSVTFGGGAVERRA